MNVKVIIGADPYNNSCPHIAFFQFAAAFALHGGKDSYMFLGLIQFLVHDT